MEDLGGHNAHGQFFHSAAHLALETAGPPRTILRTHVAGFVTQTGALAGGILHAQTELIVSGAMNYAGRTRHAHKFSMRETKLEDHGKTGKGERRFLEQATLSSLPYLFTPGEHRHGGGIVCSVKPELPEQLSGWLAFSDVTRN